MKNKNVVVNKEAVVKQNCHSRASLSGIYNARRCQMKEISLLNRCVEDPRLDPALRPCGTGSSGMTATRNRRHAEFISASSRYDNNKTLKQVQGDGMSGFTLIELLVVILIIGILAAVAVPQYKVAVVKSRVGSMLSLLTSITNAQEIYYIAHGEYADQLNKLDIDIPVSCSPIENEDETTEAFKCENYFILMYDNINNAVNASYCPNNNHNLESCNNVRDFLINRRLLYRTKTSETGGERYCFIKNESALGKQICSHLIGFTCRNC